MLEINDVLRPQIINIDGRRYRHLPQKDLTAGRNNDYMNPEQLGPYVEEDSYYYDEPESCVNECDDIEEVNNEFLVALKDIPEYYFKFIHGVCGKKRISVEQETHTTLTLPPKGSSGDVVIKGKRQGDVLAARTRVMGIIEIHRDQQPATHFFCIPLESPDLNPAFDNFKRNVLKLQPRGVDPSIFQAAERLHLTLSLTSFLNDAEIFKHLPKIESVAKELRRKYFSEKELKIVLEGIEYMNDDPGEVDVLYAKVHLPDKSDRLQQFVDEFLGVLSNEGLLKKQFDRCKLHATIINTLFRENKKPAHGRSHGSQIKERVTFDAREILKNYGDFRFGEMTFKSLDVSLKGSYDKEGRYKSIIQIDMNT